jgi:iron only hydrogenase large subunit-like protein
VQKQKAKIIDERCIDCGECIRVCPYHAKYALTDNLASISQFKYKIALPAPTLYAQFTGLKKVDRVLAGLKLMGFDDVFEVARGAEIVSEAIAQRLKEEGHIRPLISSACPAVVRLIQVRFPELLEHIVDVDAPVEVAARVAKMEFAKEHNVRIEDIGAYFITPCPAKATAIKAPLGKEKSEVDGAISILEVYGLLAGQLKVPTTVTFKETEDMASAKGIGWANSGGECAASGAVNSLAVDGIANVIRALEDIENDKLKSLDFFEGLACTGGCVGGPLVFESNFVAHTRIKSLCDIMDGQIAHREKIDDYVNAGLADLKNELKPIEVLKLDENRVKAMQKVGQIEDLLQRLPGMDCGSCGAPSCRALAEDIVRGNANEMDCIFIMREKVRHLAEEMVGLASKDNHED